MSGKERGKKLKEGEPNVRFEDEARPSAPGTENRCLTWLSPQRLDTIWVSISKRLHLPASGFERFLSGDGDSQNKRL